MKPYMNKGVSCISIFIIIFAAAPFWIPAVVWAVDSCYFTPTRGIESKWGLEIPSDFKQVYHVTSDSILARSDSYTVYEPRGDIKSFLTGFSVTKNKEEEDYVKGIMRNLHVEEQYQASFDGPYCYYRIERWKEKLTVIYIPESKRFIFAESFTKGFVE